MNQINLFCISDEELAEERAALSPADRAAVDALPVSFSAPAPVVKTKKHDPRRDAYTGPWPRKRHYHRCPECKARGSNGVNCYKQKCSAPVLLSGPCSWCRTVVAPTRPNKDAAAWRVAAYGD